MPREAVRWRRLCQTNFQKAVSERFGCRFQGHETKHNVFPRTMHKNQAHQASNGIARSPFAKRKEPKCLAVELGSKSGFALGFQSEPAQPGSAALLRRMRLSSSFPSCALLDAAEAIKKMLCSFVPGWPVQDCLPEEAARLQVSQQRLLTDSTGSLQQC